jgi:hypothetical protein
MDRHEKIQSVSDGTKPLTNETIQSSSNSMKHTMIYFIPPVMNTFMLWGENIMILSFVAAIFFIILLCYVYVNLNQYTTRISVISNAALFGKDPQAMFQYFIQNAQAESIATAMNNIQSTTENINTTTYRLDDKSTLLSRQMSKDVPESSAESTNLGVSIQKGIAQIQDTVSKLGGAFVLGNYMKKGAVQTTQSPT